MPLNYAVKSSQWVNIKDLDTFKSILKDYAGTLLEISNEFPEGEFYVTVEFVDNIDFNEFEFAFARYKESKKLSWFQRLLKRLKNLI